MAQRTGSRAIPGSPETSGASHESQVRRQLAHDLIATTPLAWDGFGLEIALTGSVSRGLADVDSDIELNVWGQTLPAPTERGIWLRAVGATEVALAIEVTDDGTTWDRWCWGGVWVETGWQAISQLEACLQEALRAERTDHAHLMLAEVVAYAVPLRTAGAFETWRAWLADYPEAVRQRVLDEALSRWDSPYTAITRWSPVRRGQILTLTEELVGDVHAVLRLLFALNREWEPDWKWIAALSDRLAHKPDRLIERIADCFGAASAPQRMRIGSQLILDTLALLPCSARIDRIRGHIRLGMEMNEGA